MSKSKANKSHKERLKNYKNKIKQMNKQGQQNGQIPQMPEVRNVPIWDKEADIVLKGFEWEAIYNTLGNLQIGVQAAQSAMNRNIISGVVRMEFQKLDPTTLTYVDMTTEEKQPYLDDFNRVVTELRNPQPKQEAVADEAPVQEKPAKPAKAKVVKMGGKAVVAAKEEEPSIQETE